MPEGYIALTGIGGPLEGLRWESESVLRIGRQASLDVVLRDSSVERVHAEVKFQGQRWLLKDLANSPFYPTLLNGKTIAGKSETVKLNDLIQVGQMRLRVAAIASERVEASSEPPAAPVSDPGPLPAHDVTFAGPIARRSSQPVTPSLASTPPDQQTPVPKGVPGVTKPGILVMTGVHRTPDAVPTEPAPAAPQPMAGASADLQVLQVQASTQQTWDQALEHATVSLSRRPDSSRPMLTLARANHQLSSQASLDDVLENILGDVFNSLDAQRAAILLVDPKTDQLELKAVHAPSPITVGKKGYSRTLAERSFRQGESLLCRDVKGDQDLHAARSPLFGTMSSIICAVLRTPRRRLGVLHLDRGALQEPFTESDLYIADAVAANMAVGIECAQLVASQSDHFLAAVTTLARTVEMRDQYTGDHTQRVTDYALMLAEEMKLSPAERYQIKIGTPLHDLGKVGIDDAVLSKPGKLTEGEFEHMKSHTIKGATMLDGFLNLAPIVPIIRSHHERWDGTGYPDKIGRDTIAITARIVAVADTFDAMTSHRPYRPALPPQLAFLELLSKAGTHFDPQIVRSFVKLRTKVESIMKTHSDVTRDA